KELREELEGLSFTHLHDLAELEVEVQLVRPTHDADAGVPETKGPVVAHDWWRAERGGIEETSGTGIPQPVLHVAGGFDLVVGESGAQLRPAQTVLDGAAARRAIDAS